MAWYSYLWLIYDDYDDDIIWQQALLLLRCIFPIVSVFAHSASQFLV